MVFSEAKWNKGAEFQQVVKGSAALGFTTVAPMLRDAYDLFIRPLIEELTDVIDTAYKEDNPTPLQSELIRLAQRANANLAMWYGFSELNMSLSSTGFTRIESDSSRSLYKYQERELRESYKEKGFNALDDLIFFFERNIADFPEFKQTKCYLESRTMLVPGASLVSEYLPINRSRLIFLRLKPHILFVEKTKLPALIGVDVLSEIAANRGDNADMKYTKLLALLQPVIINFAAARLIMASGSLTDRGLYYTSIIGGMSGNDEEQKPANMEQIAMQAKLLNADAEEYLQRANLFIKSNFPALYAGNSKDTFRVNNDGRKIFWA
ncbi:hypothetical protein A9168_08295 [Macellibacteroides sp. HH-ZS]|nr:hypothetical protein A9168_08295 [Macellibacteroides sp. HH-ZS]